MDSPVFLQTKLHPSHVVSRSLTRGRLLTELTLGAQARLVLVTGPAGSGKSTLLADFCSQHVRNIAWLGLGTEDQDPHVFFSYFLESLCSTFRGCCEKTRNQLPQYDTTDPQELCLSFINDIFAFPQRVSIVLDDYHLVDSIEPIRQFFQILCKRGPGNLTLFVVSRDLPELPIAWLRSKALLAEVHYADLRFNQEEVAQLFQELWGQELSQEQLHLLVEKTEGWATGLQLIAQRIRQRTAPEIQKIIESIGLRDESVYDYLACEVFESQPEAVREFLKVTSLPEAFNPALAKQLLPGVKVGEMLHHLQAARLFLIRLDRDGEWYRYHHLFRDFLRTRLAREHGTPVVESLHRQTAEWLFANSEVVGSLPHYLKAGDPDLACQILEDVGSELLHRGLKSSVSNWLECLPTKLLNQRPGLTVLKSELLDIQGNWPRAVEGYRKALDEYRRQNDSTNVASVLEKLGLCYIKYGETQPLLELCEEGLRLCTPQQLDLRAMLLCWLGATLVNDGTDWARGYDKIQEGHTTASASNDPRALNWATLTYGFVFHFPQGNFAEALRTLNEGLDFFGRLGWLMVLYQLAMNKAVVMIIMGRCDAAQEVIDETLIQASRAGLSYVVKGLEVLRAMAYLESGKLEQCEEVISKISQTDIPAQFKPYFYRNRMLLNSQTKNFEQANVDVQEMERALRVNGSGLYTPECRVSQAYFLLLSGDFDSALETLHANIQLCWTARAKFWEMKTWQLMAWAYWKRGVTHERREALHKALQITQFNRYDEYWTSDPWHIGLPLLVIAAAELEDPSYAEQLLGRLDDRIDPILQDLLESPEAEIRKTAVQQLARRPSDKSRLLLKQAARADSEVEVRQLAKLALRESDLSTQMEIRSLGVFKILRDGEEVDYSRLIRPMAIRLLKYFVVQGTRLVPYDWILETFWPELDSERGRHNLATHLSAIRKNLAAPSLFQRIGESYRLCQPDEIRFDVRDYEETVQKGLEVANGGNLSQAISLIEKAELLYRGDFLESDVYEEWVEVRRSELRSLHHKCIETLGDLYQQSHQYNQAVQHYQKLLAIPEPLEQVFPKLASCLQALGDRQAIRKEYELLKTRLQENLGSDPKPATQALVDSIFTSN